MEQLKPCPFCGSTDLYLETEEVGFPLYVNVPIIFCNTCKTISKTEDDSMEMREEKAYEYLKIKAIEAWNRRTP